MRSVGAKLMWPAIVAACLGVMIVVLFRSGPRYGAMDVVAPAATPEALRFLESLLEHNFATTPTNVHIFARHFSRDEPFAYRCLVKANVTMAEYQAIIQDARRWKPESEHDADLSTVARWNDAPTPDVALWWSAAAWPDPENLRGNWVGRFGWEFIKCDRGVLYYEAYVERW